MTFEELNDRIAEALKSQVLARWGRAVDRVVLQTPPRLSMGDLATPLPLELARQLKKPPREIAQQLVDGLDLPPIVSKATVEGAGYVNFHVDRGHFLAAWIRQVMSPPPPAGSRVIVEHTNINPNKAAHIGHLRNAVLGDTLVRCLRWLGYHVEAQNYIDDTGVQVADVVVGFVHILGEGIDDVRRHIEDSETPFDYFCWDLYARVGRWYEDDPSRKEIQKETLHAIEHGEGELAEIGALVAEAIVRRHVATALRLAIRYDVLTKESDIIRHRFWSNAFEKLKASGAVVHETEGRHAGCWVMKLSESPEFEGMEEPDKILVRSNGTVTYVGKDIAYQLWKFGLLDRGFDYRKFLAYPDREILWETASGIESDPDAPHFGNADRVYNVIDVRQAYLQKVVREGLRLLGHEEQADRSIHFSYEMVALSPATAKALGMGVEEADEEKAFLEMSGRKGLGVKADDLIDALEAKAAEAIGGSAEDTAGRAIDSDQRAALAHEIAVAALRYFMLKYGRNKVIAFDFAEALAFEGETGPYLQYSTVRAEKIFRRMDERGVPAFLGDDDIDRLTIGDEIHDDLWELVRMSAETTSVIRRAVETLELSLVTRHAFDLAQKFNSVYHKFPILNEKNEDERQRRAACVEVFRRTMHGLMELLGIPVPERM